MGLALWWLSPPVSADAFNRTARHGAHLCPLSHASRIVAAAISSNDSALIDQLQDERAGVEIKIQALDQLRGLPSQGLKKCIQDSTPKEPMFLTIFDLTRHTNREIASRAREIEDKSNITRIAAEQLLSAVGKIDEHVRNLLASRIEKQRALAIVEEARKMLNDRPTDERAHMQELLDSLKEEIQRTGGTRVLVPTESSQGDRYYVKAEWAPRDKKVVECLTGLFNSALISQRSLEDEQRLMRGRTNRYVYWYSKDWALWIAGEIEQCGGKASFVGFRFAKAK